MRATIGGLLLLTAAAVALAPTSADAGTLAKAGWWSRLNDGTSPLEPPAPPTVPEGGLLVGGAPDGATAIAALHFDLGEGEGSPILTLSVADGADTGGEQAVLAACLTGSAWAAASNGSWASKPFPACAEGSVTGVRSDDGATWTFALAPLLSDGIVDVVLVPGVVADLPAGLNGSTFQLAFEAPTAGSLATQDDGTDATIELPDFGYTDPGADSGGSFAAPAVGGDLSLPPAGFTASLPEADQGMTATAPLAQERNAPLPTAPIAQVEDHKALAALILALCGGALLWSAQLPLPAPRRLGTFGGAVSTSDQAEAPGEPGGLGRFSRARSGPAPRL